MINIFSNDKNKCNHINKIQDKKLKEGNIYDICISKKIINNNFLSNKNQKYNENHCAINFDEIFKLKKNDNNNNFLNQKRKISEKKMNYKNNNIIKLNSKKKKNNKKNSYNCNNKKNNKIINNKSFEAIKSDILDYDTNFESYIKNYNKKFFWKNLIFRKFDGENKLVSEIINDIKKYEIENAERSNIKISKLNNKIKKENEIISENFNVNNHKNNNNIITIKLDDDDEDNSNNINMNNLTEKEKLLMQIENTKGLENESKFLKDFLYSENYFKNNNIFFPNNFSDDDNIKNRILKENNILRQTISLKLYGVLKLIYPSLDKNIFVKNIIYLEFLANHIDKLFGDKYLLLIEILYCRLKKEAIKMNKKIIS